MFIDESGFYLLPLLVRTFAPIGQTPIVQTPLKWEHLSVIGAVTAEGRVFFQIYDHAIKGPDLVRFLRHLLRHISGKLLVVWDGLPAHRSKLIRRFLQQGGTKRVQLVQLPAYAPDLNPAEGIWNYLKRVELKNVCCHNLTELQRELRKAMERLRHKVPVLRGCVQQPGIYFNSLCPDQ